MFAFKGEADMVFCVRNVRQWPKMGECLLWRIEIVALIWVKAMNIKTGEAADC
jgi:hypothetical protein